MHEETMSFQQAIAMMPFAIQLWVKWMNIAAIGATVIFFIFRETRRDGVINIIATAVMVGLTMVLYSKVGFVRLMGLPHVLIWTPLAIHFIRRLMTGEIRMISRVAMMVFTGTILVSLVFDYLDVISYLLGDHSSMLPEG